jgi:hypothetical protein
MTLRPPSSLYRPTHVRGSSSISDIPLLSVDHYDNSYPVHPAERYAPSLTGEYNPSFRSGSPTWHDRQYDVDEALLPDNGIRLRHSHLDMNWCLFIATILSCGLTSYYAYNATLERPDPLFIPQNPDQTIGILNAMSTISIFLLGELGQAVFERTRWILASRTKGIAMTEFLGMSRATSTLGVFALFFWKKSRANSRTLGSSNGNSKFWIFKRYFR